MKKGVPIAWGGSLLLLIIAGTPFSVAAAPAIVGNLINGIINPLIRLLFGAGLIVFLWGVFEFIRALDDESKKSDGKRHMFWGIIGLAIMTSVFAIIGIIESTVNNIGS